MLLLDTQALLWVLDDNPRLGAEARARIDSAVAVHVSAASFWELAVKSMLGKVSIPDGLSELVIEQGFSMLPVTAAHAEALMRFPTLIKHDPFDRMLMAQALVEGHQLFTADRVLLATEHSWVVDATR